MTPDRPEDDEASERELARRRLAEIFGDVLPESTRDDTDEPAGGTSARDSEILRDVPPHHT